MNTRNGLRGLALALSLGVALPVLAADLGAEETLIVDEQGIVTLSGGIGIVSLEANEYVYAGPTTDVRLSHLIWQSTAPMLTAGLDVALPEGWTFSAQAQVAMGGDSYMEDYDWIFPWATGTGDDDWSDRSQHDATDLEWYFNGSVLLGHDFAVSDNVIVNVNGGLKYTDAQWSAYGGDFVYSSGGFRNDIFSEADSTKMITYRQTFPALVAGIDAEVVEGAWTLGASAHAGLTFYSKADDQHYQTLVPTQFIDHLGSAPLVSVGASATYQIADGLNVFISGTAEKIFTGRGNEYVYDMTDGSLDLIAPDMGGGDLFAATLSAGLKGTF